MESKTIRNPSREECAYLLRALPNTDHEILQRNFKPIMSASSAGACPVMGRDGSCQEVGHPHRDRWVIPESFEAILGCFDAVDLAFIGTMASARRFDTKFLVPDDQVAGILRNLQHSYAVLEVGSFRIHRYRTLYFDTRDLALFRLHLRGSRSKLKIRSRQYVDSSRSFLEAKKRMGPSRSVKDRAETPRAITEMTAPARDFVRAHTSVDPRQLRPTLWTLFDRVTLVSRTGPERLTIDLNLRFRDGGRTVALPGVAVAELKQERLDRRSVFFGHMRAARLRPVGFSKYCAGLALLQPQLRHNHVKPKLRMARKLADRRDLCPST